MPSCTRKFMDLENMLHVIFSDGKKLRNLVDQPDTVRVKHYILRLSLKLMTVLGPADGELMTLVLGPVCSDPGRPADGQQIATSYEMGAVVTFTCNRTGFMPEPATIECISITDGNVDWNNKAAPQCVGKCFCNVQGSKSVVIQWPESTR